MRYVFYFFSIGCVIFCATWAYQVNYETRAVVKRIKLIKEQIRKEEDKLIMLEGEWSYLNRPDRLSELAERFFEELSLMPLAPDNYARIDTVTFKDFRNLKLPKIDTPIDLSSISED